MATHHFACFISRGSSSSSKNPPISSRKEDKPQGLPYQQTQRRSDLPSDSECNYKFRAPPSRVQYGRSQTMADRIAGPMVPFPHARPAGAFFLFFYSAFKRWFGLFFRDGGEFGIYYYVWVVVWLWAIGRFGYIWWMISMRKRNGFCSCGHTCIIPFDVYLWIWLVLFSEIVY